MKRVQRLTLLHSAGFVSQEAMQERLLNEAMPALVNWHVSTPGRKRRGLFRNRHTLGDAGDNLDADIIRRQRDVAEHCRIWAATAHGVIGGVVR